MFTTKPSALTLTLVFYIALTLVLATGSDAKGYDPVPLHRRDHANLNRLIKKRAPQPQFNALFGGGNSNPSAANADGADPPTDTAVIPSASSSTATESTPIPSITPAPSKHTPASSSTSSASAIPSSSANDPLGLSSILDPLTSISSSLSSSSSSSSSSTSSSSLLSLPSSSTSLTPIVAISTPPVVATPTSAHVTVTTEASEASASSSASPSGSSSKITRTTLTVLIVIAACVGGTAIIWTIIRKWKLRTSSQFDERMRPIDWQPTTSDDGGVPGHNRVGSSASSFHSGSGHDGLGDGYGSTIDYGRSPSPLPPIPDHDFTAAPAALAPVGGYADLARGPSPRPQMQEALTRGPSLTRPQYDQYGVPLHHQGGYASEDPYDYNATRY